MIISETSKARERLKIYCVGNGVDLGYGGDPIVQSAVTIDLGSEHIDYGNCGIQPLNFQGDARNLYWFNDGVLDYVYSSHLLEDFTAEETPIVLNEWLRVIKPGGYLVLYCPDEPVYSAHCKMSGQSYNESHKVSIFSLAYLKLVLKAYFSDEYYEIVHEIPLIDTYCFDLVIKKISE